MGKDQYGNDQRLGDSNVQNYLDRQRFNEISRKIWDEAEAAGKSGREALAKHALNSAFDSLHIESLVREWFAPVVGQMLKQPAVDGLVSVLRSRLNRLAAPPPDGAPASGDTRVTEREAYEKWQLSRYVTMFDRNPLGTWGDAKGDKYTAPFIQSSWEAWQARAALASIQPTPATGVDRARVLEEAIAAVRSVRRRWVNGEATTSHGQAFQNACDQCVTAIRALALQQKDPAR
jgi:hypothetical protein